jgi:phasin family protein
LAFQLDVDKLIEAQRKKPDALGQATQIAAVGVRSLIGTQRQILEAGRRAASELMRDHKATGGPTEMSTNQTEFAKKVFDVSIQNARAFTGIAREPTSGVAQIIRKAARSETGRDSRNYRSSVIRCRKAQESVNRKSFSTKGCCRRQSIVPT